MIGKRRRPTLVLVLLLLPLGGLLLVPSIRWPVYGWLRGEAFYQGMPTSWWEGEIEESYQPGEYHRWSLYPATLEITWYVNKGPSLSDQVKQRLRCETLTYYHEIDSQLLAANPDVLSVLLALLRSNSAKARRLAVSGLLQQ